MDTPLPVLRRTPSQTLLILFPLMALSSCATLQPHATAPTPLAPAITAQDLHDAQVKSYREGFIAGRHYQQKQDAAAAAKAQETQEAAVPAAAPPVTPPPPVATAPLPVAASPSASGGFVTQGPAKPVALPGN